MRELQRHKSEKKLPLRPDKCYKNRKIIRSYTVNNQEKLETIYYVSIRLERFPDPVLVR